MSNDVIERAEAVLAHYGVKGMKWGQRKSSASRPAGMGGRNYDTKNKSNEELKKIIARMKLEQEYKELNKKSTSEGKKFLNELMKNSGKTAASVVVSAVVGKAIKDMLSGGGGSTISGAAGKAAGRAATRAARKRASRSTYRSAQRFLELGP